jgi:hypothetical protein
VPALRKFAKEFIKEKDDCLVLRHRSCQAMGPGDSLHRATPPCPMDAQQDYTEVHQELQNHTRAERISADIEDKFGKDFTINWQFLHTFYGKSFSLKKVLFI